MNMQPMQTIYRNHDYESSWPTIHRDACRAILVHEGCLAMIHSAVGGDYKFPGGGVKSEESMLEALAREVQEESGIRIGNPISPYVIMEEIGASRYEPRTIYRMHSHYYRATISEQGLAQQLDDYEAVAQYQLVFIRVEDALAANRALLQKGVDMPWLSREIAVLEMLLHDSSLPLHRIHNKE